MFSETPAAKTCIEEQEAKGSPIEVKEEHLENVQGGRAGQGSTYHWLDDACNEP